MDDSHGRLSFIYDNYSDFSSSGSKTAPRNPPLLPESPQFKPPGEHIL
jgi:hypothetical protein